VGFASYTPSCRWRRCGWGKLIIDEVVRLSALASPPENLSGWWSSGEGTLLATYVLIELALAVLSDLLGRVTGLVDSLLSERLTVSMSIRLMDHAATLDLQQFEDAGFQDRLERARRQASGRMALMSQILGQMQDLVTVATFAVGLLVYNPWLILLLALALVPAFLGEAHFNARSYSLDFRRTPERRELDYVRQTAASVETAKEVKIFGLSGFLRDRYQGAVPELLRRQPGDRTCAGRLGLSLRSSRHAWATISPMLDHPRHLARRSDDRGPHLPAGSFQRLRSLFSGLLTSFSSTAAQALYLEDLFGFFEARPAILSAPGALSVPHPIRQGFVFEEVGFRYPGAERWAVRHLSFTLRAGETLALVGENGAGKTTLVKLLARLYDPDEGRILLDGRPLRDYDLIGLRGRIGVIFQDYVRYNLSAGDNIAVGG
jgi:ATP-binding cassette subfamily B protein